MGTDGMLDSEGGGMGDAIEGRFNEEVERRKKKESTMSTKSKKGGKKKSRQRKNKVERYDL